MAQKEPISKFVLHDRHGREIDFSSFSVVSGVSVTLHAGVGEPYCESRYQGGILYLDFHNIKGEGVTGITYDESQEDAGTNYLHVTTDGGNEYDFPVKNGSRGNGITSIDTVESQEDGDYNIVRIHCTDDESEDGTVLRVKNGKRGNGIASVTEELSDQDGGINTHTIHYTDPNVPDSVIHTKNGRKGIQGDSAIWDENEPHEKLTDLAHDLGDSTVKPMSQKGVTDAITPIQKLINNDIAVTWIDGKFMHPATPSDLRNNADAQTSSPIPVDVGDRVMLGTYELPGNMFTAIAFLETSDQASGWVKKAGVNSYGSEKFHNLEWIADEAGYVVVSGVKNGMTLQIFPSNAVARQDDVLRQGVEINDIKAKLTGKFDDWDWNPGSLHPNDGHIVTTNTWQRYSDFVTLNKGDKVKVRTYFHTVGTYTIIANREERLEWTKSGDLRGTYLTKEYTAQSDNEEIRVCVWVGDGTENHPTMAEWEATIEKADAVVTKAEFDKALGDNASLPDYWIDYLSTKMAGFSADADCFAFLSDTHSAENAGNSGEVLHWLAKNKGISKVIHGGDICCTDGPSTSFDNIPTNFEQMLVRDIKAYDRMAERASQYARFFGVKGNHDFFEYSGGSLGAQTPADVSRHIKGLMTDLGVRDNMQADADSLYYYYDNSVAGIRYIFLDTCHKSIAYIQIGITQLEWLIDTLNGTPNDYKVIVIGHSPASTYMAPGSETLEDKIGCVREMLIEANAKASGTYPYYHHSTGIGTEEGDVTYDFSNFNGEVIAYIHGHTHIDNQLYHDGIPFIGIVCDKADQHPSSPFCENTEMAVSNKPVGTAKEQAIDVATINDDKNVISMHRIGIGYDRHFHVGVVELEVGQTLTLSPSIITAASYGGTDEDVTMSNSAWDYKHDYATINTSTGLVTAVAQGDVIAFAEDADHNKEFWHIKVTA